MSRVVPEAQLSPLGHGCRRKANRSGRELLPFSPRHWRLYYFPAYIAVPHDSGVGLMRWL